ncbi:unnamed protein product [Pleuronectes platessa]|uniref:Uncharacterized protein n=1 Tax=Pleuronectes platessa TaxID=8262 RepID=A0A9N7YIJ1_PLEPL|nr:unnamed protein product [Pleuronectes platessa]
MEDVAVSFTIKEESPDEPLWISDTAGPMGGSVLYSNPGALGESQQLEEGRHLSHPEVARLKPSEFSDLYSGHHAGQISGLHFTVKTEKEEEERSGFSQDGCQHGAGKQNQLAADFSIDERENQLWSSIIEGNDIEAGFPDFSSMVEEYSSTFPEHSDAAVVSNSSKSTGVQQPSSQRPCNGLYSAEYQKDVPQSSGFQSRAPGALPQPDRQKEQLYSQRSGSHAGHLRPPDEHAERDATSGERPAVTHSHSTFTPSSYHNPAQGVLRRGAGLRLLAVREDVQPPAPVQAAPAEPQEEAIVLVHGVWEELPVLVPPQHTPPDAHGREAVRLRAVWEEVHAAEQPEGPPAHPQRRAALQLLPVREDLHPDAPPETPQNHSHVQLRATRTF